MRRLALADSGELGGQVLFERALQHRAPLRQVRRGPVDGRGWLDKPGETEVVGQVFVPLPARQRHRNPVESPLLVDRLNLAPRERDQ